MEFEEVAWTPASIRDAMRGCVAIFILSSTILFGCWLEPRNPGSHLLYAFAVKTRRQGQAWRGSEVPPYD